MANIPLSQQVVIVEKRARTPVILRPLGLSVSLSFETTRGGKLASIESVVSCRRGADMATSCQLARDVGTVVSTATVGRFTPHRLC